MFRVQRPSQAVPTAAPRAMALRTMALRRTAPRTTGLRATTWCTAVLCVAALSACTADSPAPRGVPATQVPTRTGECNDVYMGGEPGLGAGYHGDWGARHAFGESARLWVCAHPWPGGDDDVPVFAADDPAAVTITRTSWNAATGIVEVRVTVDGPIGVVYTSTTGRGGGFGGPAISSDDEHWWIGAGPSSG